jgi:nucleotide-binding universal stress UspA family protein
MYKNLLVAVDNSSPGQQAAAMAVALGKELGARIMGLHVTNAVLHSHAFRMLEGTLPAQYQTEEVLQEQRDIHDKLIERGLNLISDSYLEDLREQARKVGVNCATEVLEGRNFEVLAERIAGDECDLAVFGHVGLGADGDAHLSGMIGSVVERVAYRVKKDVLVVRSRPNSPYPKLEEGSKILVAVDGSEHSFQALRKAIVLAKHFRAGLHAVHVFDPEFHRTVFQEMAGVLTREAAEVFDFESQQELHDTVIDGGLEQVGRRHLRSCRMAADHAQVPIRTKLLKGRFFREIVKEFSPCSVLIVNSDVPETMKRFRAPSVEDQTEPLAWSAEGEAMIGRAPEFVQKMARHAIEDWARRQGRDEVDPETVLQAMKELLPEKMLRKMIKEEE